MLNQPATQALLSQIGRTVEQLMESAKGSGPLSTIDGQLLGALGELDVQAGVVRRALQNERETLAVEDDLSDLDFNAPRVAAARAKSDAARVRFAATQAAVVALIDARKVLAELL